MVLRVFHLAGGGGVVRGKPIVRKPALKGVLPINGLRKWIGAGDSPIGTPSAVIGRSVKQALLVAGGNVGLMECGDPGTTR